MNSPRLSPSLETEDSQSSLELTIKSAPELLTLERVCAGQISEIPLEWPRETTDGIFRRVYAKWTREPAHGTREPRETDSSIITATNISPIVHVIQLGIKNFNITEDNINMPNIQANYRTCVYEVLQLYNYYKKKELLLTNDPVLNQQYFVMVNKMFEIIYYTEQTIRSAFRMKLILDPMYDSTLNDDIGIFKFHPHEHPDKNSPYQNLLLCLLRTLNESQYRRYGDFIYKMRFTEGGHFTYSWKEAMTIKEFVYQATQKETNYGQWLNATKNQSNIDHCIKYLTHCVSAEFPILKKNRHVFSFRNGVYITKVVDKTGTFHDSFYKYGSSISIPSSEVACKFFDIEFNEEFSKVQQKDWYSIPTPNLQKIIDFQFADLPDKEQICKWFYIFIGKLLYEIKELERWQILPYIYGVANSGKSTICDVIKSIFEARDVGVVENTIEEKFGLAPVAGKYIFIASEIKKNFSLDQALFQKIISGEEVALAQKNRDPLQLVWIMPGFMVSNEIPAFIDSAGSIARRVVLFKFMKLVSPNMTDGDLILKMSLEMAALIKKCNMGYLHTVNTYKGRDVWDILPPYFLATRESLGQETNPMKGFLGSSKLVFGEGLYCKEKAFKEAFNEYCKENNLGKIKWTPAIYEEPFLVSQAKHKTPIAFIKKRRQYPRNETGKFSTATFITGLDLADENDGSSETETSDIAASLSHSVSHPKKPIEDIRDSREKPRELRLKHVSSKT